VILYCDTSALIKLLILEPQSDLMQAVCNRAEAIAVGRITWVEAMAGLAQKLVETAGRFADVFSLRAYDSVQLAAAHELQAITDVPVTFACFDRRLNQAAQLLQLAVLP